MEKQKDMIISVKGYVVEENGYYIAMYQFEFDQDSTMEIAIRERFKTLEAAEIYVERNAEGITNAICEKLDIPISVRGQFRRPSKTVN